VAVVAGKLESVPLSQPGSPSTHPYHETSPFPSGGTHDSLCRSAERTGVQRPLGRVSRRPEQRRCFARRPRYGASSAPPGGGFCPGRNDRPQEARGTDSLGGCPRAPSTIRSGGSSPLVGGVFSFVDVIGEEAIRWRGMHSRHGLRLAVSYLNLAPGRTVSQGARLGRSRWGRGDGSGWAASEAAVAQNPTADAEGCLT
jgi:hypothetical protein